MRWHLRRYASYSSQRGGCCRVVCGCDALYNLSNNTELKRRRPRPLPRLSDVSVRAPTFCNNHFFMDSAQSSFCARGVGHSLTNKTSMILPFDWGPISALLLSLKYCRRYSILTPSRLPLHKQNGFFRVVAIWSQSFP